MPFPGEAPVHARLTGGPVLDLNIMTRRGVMAHRMVAMSAGEALPAEEWRALRYANGDAPIDLAELLALVAGRVPLLIEIKSRMLLPPKKTAEGEEAADPRAELRSKAAT